MKQVILTVGLYFLISVSLLQANHSHHSAIEGFWRSTNTNIVIEIDRANNGIKVRRANNGKWKYYRKIVGFDIYSDHYGKKFKLVDANELVWMKNSYINADQFIKVRNDDYGYLDNHHDNHDYLNGVYCEADHIHNHPLNGEWVSRSAREVLHIQPTRFGLEVRKNGSSRWRDYRAVTRRKFRDRSGNTIKVLDNNELYWKSDCGRYKIYYGKARHRHRRHRH